MNGWLVMGGVILLVAIFCVPYLWGYKGSRKK